MTSSNHTKKRTVESIATTREYIQHVLMAVALLHHGTLTPPSGRLRMIFPDENLVLDLTEFKNEFFKDRTSLNRFKQATMSIVVNGITRAFEAAKYYFKHRCVWNDKRWDDLYLVSSQIRNMASHNFIWTFEDWWISKLRENEKDFPLMYGDLTIELPWRNQKASLGQLPPGKAISLIQSIYGDVKDSG